MRGMGNLPTNFAVSGIFIIGLWTRYNDLSDEPVPHDLVTVTFDFGGHGAARDVAVHASTVYQVSSFSRKI